MGAYIVRRLLLMIPTLFGIMAISFAITQFAPGGPVEELIADYRKALTREVSDLDWFQALACFKSTATWSLIVKHNRRRATPDPALEAMATRLPALLAKARQYLG